MRGSCRRLNKILRDKSGRGVKRREIWEHISEIELIGRAVRFCIWRISLRSPAQVEGTQVFLPRPERDLESP